MRGLIKLLVWAVVIAGGYYALEYVRVHTSGDVVTYKRFAKAVMEDNIYIARQASSKELAAKVLSKNEERMKPFKGGRILLTYFEVVRRVLSSDGKTSMLVVEQVTRVGSHGQTGIWGDQEVRARHTVQVEKSNQVWKVTEFVDQAMYQ